MSEKRRPPRWVIGSFLVLMTILVLIAFYVIVQKSAEQAASIAFGPNDPPGPMPNVRDWPLPIQKVHSDLVESEARQIEGFLLAGRSGVDSVDAAVFRLPVTASRISRITSQLNLVPVSSTHSFISYSRDLILSTGATQWWRLSSRPDVQYFVSRRVLTGEEGDLFAAAYDSVDQQLFILYTFNF